MGQVRRIVSCPLCHRSVALEADGTIPGHMKERDSHDKTMCDYGGRQYSLVADNGGKEDGRQE